MKAEYRSRLYHALDRAERRSYRRYMAWGDCPDRYNVNSPEAQLYIQSSRLATRLEQLYKHCKASEIRLARDHAAIALIEET